LAARHAPRPPKYAESSVTRFSVAKSKIRILPLEGSGENGGDSPVKELEVENFKAAEGFDVF
jgi:hypothetical protein